MTFITGNEIQCDITIKDVESYLVFTRLLQQTSNQLSDEHKALAYKVNCWIKLCANNEAGCYSTGDYVKRLQSVRKNMHTRVIDLYESGDTSVVYKTLAFLITMWHAQLPEQQQNGLYRFTQLYTSMCVTQKVDVAQLYAVIKLTDTNALGPEDDIMLGGLIHAWNEPKPMVAIYNLTARLLMLLTGTPWAAIKSTGSLRFTLPNPVYYNLADPICSIAVWSEKVPSVLKLMEWGVKVWEPRPLRNHVSLNDVQVHLTRLFTAERFLNSILEQYVSDVRFSGPNALMENMALAHKDLERTRWLVNCAS